MKNLETITINPFYTFENFVVGESNQFAYTVAKSVADNPTVQYNPLFIYGNVGLGKTHLLHAIGNEMLRIGKTVVYVTLGEFTNLFIEHIRTKSMESFREHFRNCDLLLIDDIQFLSQKEKTQDEFFHTFNKLYGEGKQIVLTADKPPKKIIGLEERLRSRFEWGLMTNIQSPDLQMKISIIYKKCQLNKMRLDSEIVEYIAVNMGENIREIEGALLKLNALSILMNHKISLDFAKEALKDHIHQKANSISIAQVVETVAKELNVKPSALTSKRRQKDIVHARRVAVYIARQLTTHSMPQLAMYFGLKDHSSIVHMLHKIHQQIDENPSFKTMLDALMEKVKHA